MYTKGSVRRTANFQFSESKFDFVVNKKKTTIPSSLLVHTEGVEPS